MSDRQRVGFVAGLIGCAAAARLLFLHFLHPLNWDEIEFFRATDWIRRGMVPYRDFWEHHTPLQWFLFAPLSGLTHSAGAHAIIFMRWIQVPLWIAIFFLLNQWMRDALLSPIERWTALAFPLTSTLFMLPAVEYRVDVVAAGLLIAPLVCIQRMQRSVWYAIAAGAALCLCGFANLRMGPVLVLTMLMARVVDIPNRRWRGDTRANWIFAGAAGTFVLCSLYFVVTGSARIAFRHLITENYLADKWAIPPIEHMLLHRLIAPFGLHLAYGQPPFTPSTIDPAGIVLVIGGAAAMIHVLWTRRRSPDALFFLAFVQFANLLFVSAMKFVFNYHLMLASLLMVPLLAAEFERFASRRALVAIVTMTTVVNVAVAIFRGKEDDLKFQDTIMRTVDAQTPPSAPVWDSAGWALHRPPAYRYWFLRAIVVVLEQHGIFQPYRPTEAPAAIIADYDTRVWMARHHSLAVFLSAHYLPMWTNLWLPGLSARVRPATAARWIAPARGTYAVYASSRLAQHPWFANPLDLDRAWWRNRSVTAVHPDDQTPDVAFVVNGLPMRAPLILKARDVVIAMNRSPQTIGVLATPIPREQLFMAPPDDITIEASASPRWHIPHFR